MKKLIIVFIIVAGLIHPKLALSDCIACWQLEKVEIVLADNSIVKGYIKWNDAWVGLEERELSIDRKVKYLLNNASWYELVIYREIFQFTKGLPSPVIVTSNSTDTIHYDNLISLREIPSNKNYPMTAGPIFCLERESLELLNNKPLHLHKDENIGCESYFLNYNPGISEDEFITIVNDRKFWMYRKEYEKKKIIGLMHCWD